MISNAITVFKIQKTILEIYFTEYRKMLSKRGSYINKTKKQNEKQVDIWKECMGPTYIVWRVSVC